MKFPRLPRFKRAPSVAPIQLTDRDREIIRLVNRYRFLRSSHIVVLLDCGSQPILRRLQMLYHHGFLERPLAQIDYYHQGGSRQIVYGLGNKGAQVVKSQKGVSSRGPRLGEKNRSVGRMFFEHALLVSDTMVALELGCRKMEGVRLLAGDDVPLSGAAPRPHPFKWKVKVNGRVKLGIIPDQVFALENEEESPDRSPAMFFLEADRGTMPVVRKNLAQTSFHRKLLAYEATWNQGIHRSQFGFKRFRVLTVTTSAGRVDSLIEACSQLKNGHGLFLFTDVATLLAHGNIFTLPWKTGRRGEIVRLLD